MYNRSKTRESKLNFRTAVMAKEFRLQRRRVPGCKPSIQPKPSPCLRKWMMRVWKKQVANANKCESHEEFSI